MLCTTLLCTTRGGVLELCTTERYVPQGVRGVNDFTFTLRHGVNDFSRMLVTFLVTST